jgi:antitoxin component of MazEF toxin-antitoxin module
VVTVTSRKILRLGTSMAITLPPEYARGLGLGRGKGVTLVQEGKRLTVLPMSLDRRGRERLQALVERLRELEGKARAAGDAEGALLLRELEELLPWPEESRAKLGELVARSVDRYDLAPLLEAYGEFELVRAGQEGAEAPRPEEEGAEAVGAKVGGEESGKGADQPEA